MSMDEKLALRILRRFVATPFDRDCQQHEQLLRRLFKLCFPEAGDEAGLEENPRWKEIGFQSEDPRRDFRGGGLFALQNLCFFRAFFPTEFVGIARRSYSAGFPMAAAFINVTHMLAGYLRLTDSVGLGAGEPLASRRALRHFARLCLAAEDGGRAAECCSFQASLFRGPSPLPHPRSSELFNIQSHSDSEVARAVTLGGSMALSSTCCNGKEKSRPTPSGATLELPAFSVHSNLNHGLRQGLSATDRQSAVQRRVTTAGRVLYTFGHLFVYSCMRLDQELALRGAWEPEGEDPPLPAPGFSSLHLPALRRHHLSHRGLHAQPTSHSPRFENKSNSCHPSMSASSSRREELSPRGTQKQQPGEDPRKASVECLSDDSTRRKDTFMSFSSSTAGHNENSSPPSLACQQEQPCLPSAPGTCGRPPVVKEGQPLHRRAHLCFGEALKEVRNAVDSVLYDGGFKSVQDLEAICRCC
ncbi:uncharacterized protein LOC34621242 [Cyclospora cayetanensis]|nr:uncharacterized protein LOC34621242 [Cyclospora cayetanensis]